VSVPGELHKPVERFENENIPKLRFSVTLGEEPEVEVALV
jgi:hypothetical protein